MLNFEALLLAHNAAPASFRPDLRVKRPLVRRGVAPRGMDRRATSSRGALRGTGCSFAQPSFLFVQRPDGQGLASERKSCS